MRNYLLAGVAVASAFTFMIPLCAGFGSGRLRVRPRLRRLSRRALRPGPISLSESTVMRTVTGEAMALPSAPQPWPPG